MALKLCTGALRFELQGHKGRREKVSPGQVCTTAIHDQMLKKHLDRFADELGVTVEEMVASVLWSLRSDRETPQSRNNATVTVEYQGRNNAKAQWSIKVTSENMHGEH